MTIFVDITEPNQDGKNCGYDARIETKDARMLGIMQKLLDNGDIYDFTISQD